jgi:2-polyprenyl-6-methoxyphenol hydroxylase-like FAD-dependent oxidoreductase
MKVLIVGAGPAGLSLATLLAEGGRCRTIDLVERTASDEAVGAGITLRNDSLSFLGLGESLPVRRLQGRSLWYRGTRVVDLPYPPGIHLVTTSRTELLRALRRRCHDAGVEVAFGTDGARTADARLATYDLVVAADGARSALRQRHQSAFGVTARAGLNRYAWFRTQAPASSLSIFVGDAATPLIGWAYESSADLSTLIVECGDSTFRKLEMASMCAGLCGRMIARAFERELDGEAVVADTPFRWRRFTGLTCRRLFHDNLVLIGDAAHTTHFSQGFGTAFAFDDAVALAAALASASDLSAALQMYESSQQPKIHLFQKTATHSMEWAESLARAAEDGDEPSVHTLIAARWPNNEVTASPFSATARAVAAPSAQPAPSVLDQALRGYRVTQMLHVAAKLGIADHVADSPRSAADIATLVGAHADAVARLLRALVDVGVFARDANDCFQLTASGRQLRSDAPDSLRSTLIMHGEPWWWDAWGGLGDAVRTGTTAFDAVHGVDLFGYLAAHPEASRLFNASMQRMTAEQAAAIVPRLDLQGTRRLMDVGGGHGALVSAVLSEVADISAVVFDHPFVVAGTRQRLATLLDAGRCSVIGGDFFDAVPAGADTYTLKDVLHDWDDENSLAILRNVKRAMTPEARLLVIERLLPEGRTPSSARLIDIAMLVLTGGRERTENEYRRLLSTAGLKVRTVTGLACDYAALEASL